LENAKKSILSAKRWLHEKVTNADVGRGCDVVRDIRLFACEGERAVGFIGRMSWRAVREFRRRDREGVSCPGFACSWTCDCVGGKSRSVGNPCVARQYNVLGQSLEVQYLLGEIDSLIVIILRTSIHALVRVLLVLELVLLLGRRRWRRELFVSAESTVGIHAAEPVGDHRAGSQMRRRDHWMLVWQAVRKAGRSSGLHICRARFRGLAKLFCLLGRGGEQTEAFGARCPGTSD
jgi:hypothetical protein